MQQRYEYFVVLAEMRTGSNLLERNLIQLDGIEMYGEAYNPAFIHGPKKDNILGITKEERDEDPLALLQAIRSQTTGLPGFRYFSDHDPRVLETILNDPKCAKIVLSRNPLDSYISLKNAKDSGRWISTGVQGTTRSKVTFKGDDFLNYLVDRRRFQGVIMRALQVSGQTAFFLRYEDANDLEVLNGIAAFLGCDSRIEQLQRTLKPQNPLPTEEKVANFDAVTSTLSRIDMFGIFDTPVFEPSRGAGVPSYVATANAPLLFLPINGGPNPAVMGWMAEMDGIEDRQELLRGFSQKDLRGWMRSHKGHRSFTVIRHPLRRAHSTFCRYILNAQATAYAQVRAKLRRKYDLPVPEGCPDASWSKDDHRNAFLEFLKFLDANLKGQTSVRVDGSWASQLAVLQGYSSFAPVDRIIREERLQEELDELSAAIGGPSVPLSSPPDESPYSLDDIYDRDVEKAAKAAYQRDYLHFGFRQWAG